MHGAQVRDMSDNPMAKHKRVRRSKEEDPTMETRILESCVRKILSLLAIGFGEAGSEVCHTPSQQGCPRGKHHVQRSNDQRP